MDHILRNGFARNMNHIVLGTDDPFLILKIVKRTGANRQNLLDRAVRVDAMVIAAGVSHRVGNFQLAI